jgi:hypothetical protein
MWRLGPLGRQRGMIVTHRLDVWIRPDLAKADQRETVPKSSHMSDGRYACAARSDHAGGSHGNNKLKRANSTASALSDGVPLSFTAASPLRSSTYIYSLFLPN